MASVPPPGGKPTMSLMLADWAWAKLLDRANTASSPKAQRLKGLQSVVNKFRYMVISIEYQTSCANKKRFILQQKTS
jgi:hypothetical protein